MFNFDTSRAEFRSLYFEKKPWLKRKCFDPSPFGWSTIDQALDFQDPTRELLKVLHKGRVEPSHYVEEYMDVGLRRRRVRKDRLYQMLASGATVVLNRIELVSTQVRDVCLEIGRLVGAQTTSNAYACLGGEPATNVHWDTHDVFVVQIGGLKRWRIYEPTHLLPVSNQVSNDRKDELPAEPVMDEILEAGDTLYVPRGWWHRVEPVEGSDTLHLTVAIHAPLMLDYLVWACASVLPDLLEVRHSLVGEAHDSQRVADAVAAVGELLTRPETVQAFRERSQQRDRVVSPFNIATLLDQAKDPLPMSAKLILNSRHVDRDQAQFDINGTAIPLRGAHRAVAAALSAGVSVNMAQLQRQLPEFPVETLGAIVKDLARADIIQITFPEETRKSSRTA
ncbi:JmjC domain-containing protein [Niveispirillum irakense]|uniref:JmjC domain-containing protein n=1 Tax=Niveispirillum irakense TaxID=34011 RepID=UPI0004219761|nr:cupin domain-containing protein [Niveispirillum irakense]